MTRPCPGPRAVTGKPGWAAPPGATDCHMHIFGPYGRYPLSPGRGYTPPEASIAMYRDMLGTIGLELLPIIAGLIRPSEASTLRNATPDNAEAAPRSTFREWIPGSQRTSSPGRSFWA